VTTKIKRRVQRLPVTKARVNLGAVLKHVHEKQATIILERNGEPVAAIMDIDEFEDYVEINDPAIKLEIEASRREFEAGKGRPARELLAELEATPVSS